MADPSSSNPPPVSQPKRLAKWYNENVALELENTGSVARDHLANERTYLAWLRTSLAFCSVGVALTQLFSLSSPLSVDPIPSPPPDMPSAAGLQADLVAIQNVYESILRAMNEARENRKFARPLGGLLVGLGFLILVNGVSRYFSVQKYLVVNKFPSTRLPVLMVSVITGAAIVIVLGVVLGM